MARRLPIYLLVGTSASMYGEPIVAVQIGIQSIISTLQSEPYLLETGYLSVISFDDIARELLPLTEVASCQFNVQLQAQGERALGAGLKLLGRRIREEFVKTTPERKGDWAPLVFILIDGPVTDDLASGWEAVKNIDFGAVVCCLVGSHANINELKILTNNVLSLAESDPSRIREFIKWISYPLN